MCWYKFSFIAVLIALTAGCVGIPRQDPTSHSWEQHSSDLAALEQWKMQGKMAFRNADRAESASITWLQNKENTEVRLSGPLGFSATTISGDGEVVTVVQADETRRYPMSDTAAILSNTGIELPLQALPYWLKGLPDPRADIVEQELQQGQLKLLVQSGWAISYEQYKFFDRHSLPTKLKMRRTDTLVRVIMRHWKTEGIK
ncbi:MAG: lipoprotein insertase outer membrane protein LolB [Halioglobus sp.]